MLLKLSPDKEGNLLRTEEPDCGADPIAALKTMFVDMVMGARINRGQNPVTRPVFRKTHGVARAAFVILDDLPEDLRVGVFRGGQYPAWVRFSSDSDPFQSDLKTTLGIGIKLFGVPERKLLESDANAETHDFLLQNHPVFFVDDARAMCEFTYAGVVMRDYESYLEKHPETAQILNEMEKVVASALQTDYWSVLPFAFGDKRFVKYKLVPSNIPAATDENNFDNPNFLHEDLKNRLGKGTASFDFYLQFQTNDEQMPLDRATVLWDEELSEPIRVATLIIERQDIDARGQATYGENLAFNTWHALPEHKPVGSISDARKVAYEAAAELRRNMNGIPLGEPDEPRPSEVLNAKPRDTKIVQAKIHPAIGVARIGNSAEYFLAPETTAVQIETKIEYKDKTGALKREAARFRIYGYNAAGEVVAELNAGNAEIHWTVHVANRKAAWYQFQLALDVPEAHAADLPASKRRNADIRGADRQKLVIDPGARTITGANKSGDEYKFNTGKFFDKPVYLGELKTDDAGRLVFLGGRGVSASRQDMDVKLTDFANNDGWHDDVSDGPVTATVKMGEQEIPVESAWVVVAPPNYAPAIIGVRTLYDLLFDVFVQDGRLPFPADISFTKDIYPILFRLSNLQWVNQGFAVGFGAGSQQNFADPDYISKLANPGDEFKELRLQICNLFRDFDRDGKSPVPLPWIYGDAMNVPPADTPRQHITISPTQQRMLQLWADGKFVSDWQPEAIAAQNLDDLPLAERPAMVDRAVLEFCLADAFHPGCEVTWTTRHGSMYSAPFRIRRRRETDGAEPDFGSQITPEMVFQPNGVLYGQSPGTISRWMALPWQTDTASCRSGYYAGFGQRYDPYLPTFWAARVPNHVLTEDDYKVAVDDNEPPEKRLQAFRRRASWFRGLNTNYLEAIAQMVLDFGKMGVVEARKGVEADAELPAVMYVESEPGFANIKEISPHRNLMMLHVAGADVEDTAAAEVAATSAAETTGHFEEEFTSGFINKVNRFRNR
ncbi:MAG TPA: LodA/GoxA family CTQ-dependent oxidase [Pyrinomonadaceae bacterium]|jgi:hypothetical protein